MPVKRTKKAAGGAAESVQIPLTEETRPQPKTTREDRFSRETSLTAKDFVGALNTAVSNVQSLFQLKEQLTSEIDDLKAQLKVGADMKLEQENLQDLKREEEIFEYEFSLKKERLEKELALLETDKKKKFQEMEEEQKEKLKTQAETHALKSKIEKEEYERKQKLEREDFQRELAQLEKNKKTFEAQQKDFEAEKTRLRDTLVKELNRDNTHEKELLKLNHQKEIEVLKGELKLVESARIKFETLLQETRLQNEKLSEQLSQLSREALTSASNASMAVKLKDIVSQLAQGPSGTSARVN